MARVKARSIMEVVVIRTFLERRSPLIGLGAGYIHPGSVKRVASAVGEGSMAVSLVHMRLEALAAAGLLIGLSAGTIDPSRLRVHGPRYGQHLFPARHRPCARADWRSSMAQHHRR